jgi:hypothetical protein
MRSTTHSDKSQPADPASIRPAPATDYSHLIPVAHRVLRATAALTWKMMKGLAIVAFRLPRLFVKANKDNLPRKDKTTGV